MRRTIINWNELCELVKDIKKEGQEGKVLLKPISVYGVKYKDKEEVNQVQSITLEVIELYEKEVNEEVIEQQITRDYNLWSDKSITRFWGFCKNCNIEVEAYRTQSQNFGCKICNQPVRPYSKEELELKGLGGDIK